MPGRSGGGLHGKRFVVETPSPTLPLSGGGSSAVGWVRLRPRTAVQRALKAPNPAYELNIPANHSASTSTTPLFSACIDIVSSVEPLIARTVPSSTAIASTP